MSDKIYISSQTRPVRYAYLVRSANEFIDAVKFYTHSWGGTCNIILPIPQTDYQAKLFEHALYEFCPDLILYVDGPIPEKFSIALEGITVPKLKFGNSEIVEDFAKDKLRVLYKGIKLPHMMDAQFVQSHDPGPILCLDNGAVKNKGLAIQSGISSGVYTDFVKENRDVMFLKMPSSYEEYIMASILIASERTMRKLTTNGLDLTLEPEGLGLDSTEFLYLYLYHESDLSVWSSYWNQSSFFARNKLLLPRDLFLDNISKTFWTLLHVSTSFRYIRLVLNTTRESAMRIRDNVYAVVDDISERTINVDVIFDGDIYNVETGLLAYKKPLRTSTLIDEGFVKFKPIVPKGFEDTGTGFAVDAELSTHDGRRIGLPDSISSSRILTFGAKTLEKHSYDYDAIENWFQRPRIRSTRRGISTITSSKEDGLGADTLFALPSDEAIVNSYIRQAGFVLSPNESAHYARAFLRKIGFTGSQSESFDELDVARALDVNAKERTPDKEKGKDKRKKSTFNQIAGNFLRMKKIGAEESRAIIEKTLPILLQSGLARRGYSIECSHCLYLGWYPIGEVDETVKCISCGEYTVTPLGSVFEYRQSELTRGFFEEGGRAVVNTLWLFTQRSIPGAFGIGGEIVRPNEKNKLVDVDMILLTTDEIAVVECKDWRYIRKDKETELRDSIKKLIESATYLGAQSAYFSMVTQEPYEKVVKYIKPFYKSARSKNIALRLILNEQLYEFRIVNGKFDVASFELKRSILYRFSNRKSRIIGERFRDHSSGDYNEFYIAQKIEAIKQKLMSQETRP